MIVGQQSVLGAVSRPFDSNPWQYPALRHSQPGDLKTSVPPDRPISFVTILLQTLCRHENSQLLWNQANPDSFAETRGDASTPQPQKGAPGEGYRNPGTVNLTTFRMKCKHLQKYVKTKNFLSPFRMNTYAKGGEGVYPNKRRLSSTYLGRVRNLGVKSTERNGLAALRRWVPSVTVDSDARHSHPARHAVLMLGVEVSHESSSSEIANRTEKYSVCH